MSLWDKLFGWKRDGGTSPFNEYKRELEDSGLATFADLQNLLSSLIRKTTRLDVQPASRPPENSQLRSQFGGQPYFNEGEQWPVSKAGTPLSFVFQVYNGPGLELPGSIALIQFYYDWEGSAWDTGDDGWVVKIYSEVNKEKVALVEKPAQLEEASNYCEISFRAAQSLPDWEGIYLHGNSAFKLSATLNSESPWETYNEAVTKLIGEQNYQSQLGGYPRWVQGEATPKDSKGNPMKLLFQIDSEDNAGIMWGDVGLIYVFYDEENKRIEFGLQCH